MYLYQQQQQVYGGEGQLRVSVQWGKADFLQLPENTNASSAARLHNHLFRNYSMAAVEVMYKFPPMNAAAVLSDVKTDLSQPCCLFLMSSF